MILKLSKTCTLNSLVIATAACSDHSIEVSQTVEVTTISQDLNAAQTEPLKPAASFNVVDELISLLSGSGIIDKGYI